MNTFTYILLTFTMFLWGGTFIAGRLLATALSAPSAAFLRFFTASLALFLLIKLSPQTFRPLSKQQLIHVIILGATGVFSYNYCFFSGLQYVHAGRAALIIATTPLVVALFSAFFLHEKFNIKIAIGIIISLAGALLVISGGDPLSIFSGSFGKGEFYICGCVISWAIYTIIGKKALKTLSPLVAVFYSSVSGTILLLIPALFSGLARDIFELESTQWLGIIYLGVLGTAIGFSLYYWAINRIGAAKSSVFINLVPVFALLLAWLILDEKSSLSVIAGGAMVLTGVTLTNLSRGNTAKALADKR